MISVALVSIESALNGTKDESVDGKDGGSYCVMLESRHAKTE